ncbi:hypothetical protein SFA90_04415 [Enterococcus faecium]|nr:hypothetical protein SFA90_04415 [Enterococcus faecium]
MGNFAFIITFLSEFAVLAQNEGTGIFATFVAMYLIRYGLSTFLPSICSFLSSNSSMNI